MKKIILATLVLALLLTSCSNNENKETETQPDTSNESIVETDSTLGDEEGDGIVDDTEYEENIEEPSAPVAVEKVENADDALAFIAANVYSLSPDNVPMFTDGIALDLTQTDTVKYYTGLTDTTGINDIIISESGVGSIPYSYVMLRTDGSDVAGIQEKLGSSINPAKWICVSAEKVATVALDNDVVLIMGYTDTVDAIMNATITAAEGVYTNIGSVVNVLG